jgi:hypothetical protein
MSAPTVPTAHRSSPNMRRAYTTAIALEILSLIALWWLQAHFG